MKTRSRKEEGGSDVRICEENWSNHISVNQAQPAITRKKGGKCFRHWKRANVVCICVKYKQCSSLSINAGLLDQGVTLDLGVFLEIY